MSNQIKRKWHYKTGVCAFVSEFLYRVTESGGKGVPINFLHRLAQEYYGAVIGEQEFTQGVLDGGGKIGKNGAVKTNLTKRWNKFTRDGFAIYPKEWSFSDIPDDDLQMLESRIHNSGKAVYSMVPAHWDKYEIQRFADIKVFSDGCGVIDFKKEIYDAWKDPDLYAEKPTVIWKMSTKMKTAIAKEEQKRLKFLAKMGYSIDTFINGDI
jgi:hypothetical protein